MQTTLKTKQEIITQVDNKISQKFQKVIDSFNSKHNRVTNLVERNWTTRVGQFNGSKKEDGSWKIAPFVIVEIHYRDFQVYKAHYTFDKVPNNKQLRTGFESLWEHFVEHAMTMVMIKFQHFYEQQQEGPVEQPKQANKLILP